MTSSTESSKVPDSALLKNSVEMAGNSGEQDFAVAVEREKCCDAVELTAEPDISLSDPYILKGVSGGEEESTTSENGVEVTGRESGDSGCPVVAEEKGFVPCEEESGIEKSSIDEAVDAEEGGVLSADYLFDDSVEEKVKRFSTAKNELPPLIRPYWKGDESK